MDTAEHFALRMHVQIKKILTDRFDEGVRRGHDPKLDEDYDLNWIEKHGKEFEKKWEECLCSTCKKAEDCGFKLAIMCDYHDPKINFLKKVVDVKTN